MSRFAILNPATNTQSNSEIQAKQVVPQQMKLIQFNDVKIPSGVAFSELTIEQQFAALNVAITEYTAHDTVHNKTMWENIPGIRSLLLQLAGIRNDYNSSDINEFLWNAVFKPTNIKGEPITIFGGNLPFYAKNEDDETINVTLVLNYVCTMIRQLPTKLRNGTISINGLKNSDMLTLEEELKLIVKKNLGPKASIEKTVRGDDGPKKIIVKTESLSIELQRAFGLAKSAKNEKRQKAEIAQQNRTALIAARARNASREVQDDEWKSNGSKKNVHIKKRK
jgi:hypothetical protein